MPEAKWNRAKDVFHQALAKSGPDRVRFVDDACGNDAEVRAQVEALLAAHDAAGNFLVLPTTSAGAGATAPGAGQEQPGTRIGPYKLLQLIGEGGFGEVYMAEQEEPIRRRVALKIIKPGMGTKEVIARFESERQALALMDHPNIAKVFDAGATESGRPYFVMELVKGVPITDYCDANRLSTRDRLDLFVQVCRAVHHAHEKGIVHRDIKPSNVMVTLHDGTPVPKVIDFGVAKATNQRLTEKTLFTAYGACVGTPVYMSPEQAEMSGLDVDRRSDIYSLGVLLYELLTGTTPFNAERLRAAAFIELLRIIREEDPPTPSNRLSTLGDQLADIASKRGSDPQLLAKLVRGDLDWIVMKTIDKDRRRRYDTVADLVADMSRYFKDEPVIARRPSVAYRLGKFAKRRRASLITAAGIAAAVIAGTALAQLGGFGFRGSAAALPTGTLTARRVDVPLDLGSALTPDGRLAAITDWSSGDLAVYDMSSGQTRRLMASPGWSPTSGWVEGGVLSPDLRQVAYTWSTQPGLEQRYQLRVMPNQPGAPPRILVDSPENVYFVPAAWSRDGQSVLAHMWKPDRSMQLAWISAADGAIRVLKSLGRRTSDRVSLSPDGRHLVYSARQRPDTVNSSIYVMAADGSGETELAGGSSINEAPAWTPDGARVFFTSNRSGPFALWSIDVRNGTASGAPALIKPELGRILTMGFTSSGTYYYMHVTATRDLFVAELNPSDSKLRGPAAAITETYTGSRLPAWSPDGKAVAFARETNAITLEDSDLVVRLLDTGHERTYAGADVAGQPIWLPDGKSLLIPARRQNRASLQRVNLETGEFTLVLDKNIRQAALAPDGRTLYAAVDRTIQAIDLPTGRERQVFAAPGPNNVSALALSPNGQTLAFPLERRAVGLVGVDGAGFREFPAAGIRQVAWTRDGRAILYEAFGASALGAGGPADRKLMRLPVEGGTPEFTGVDLEGVFSLTSDGTRLVFSRSRGTLSQQRRVEVWALDNLLAKPAR